MVVLGVLDEEGFDEVLFFVLDLGSEGGRDGGRELIEGAGAEGDKGVEVVGS